MRDKLFYLVFFSFILAISRIIPHPPNFTPIIASAILAPLFIKDRWYGMAIPIAAMFISDILIGFHTYQIVVYLTLLSISCLSPMLMNYKKITILAISGSVWFFITTNFAVWAMWSTYPKTIEGLLACYTLAIPFFQYTLISTCLFTGLLVILYKYVEVVNEKTNSFLLKIIRKNKNII